MSTATPLSDAELTRFCALLEKAKRGNDLTTAENAEYDLLAARGKKKVVWPPILPPTIIIPITHETDFVCRIPTPPVDQE
jgi:hypothetical protein